MLQQYENSISSDRLLKEVKVSLLVPSIKRECRQWYKAGQEKTSELQCTNQLSCHVVSAVYQQLASLPYSSSVPVASDNL